MVTIEINIPRNTLGIKWTKVVHRKFAVDASELSTRQLLAYCKTLADHQTSALAPVDNGPSGDGELKIKLLSKLYRLPKLLLFKMSRIQLAQLTLHLNPLLENFQITKNHFPTIHGLYGPGDYFKYIRLGEFIVADQYFEAFQNTGDGAAPRTKYLDLLIATLWREKAKEDINGDWRMPFKSSTIEKRSKKIKRWPINHKRLMYLYFAGCKQYLAERYDTLFSASDQSEGGDWLDLVRTLPNEKFGTLAVSEQLYIHTIFDIVNRMMRDQKKTRIE